LYATENDKNMLGQVKFSYPDFDWTCYAIEFDADDLFFCLVDGFEEEFDYFRLPELFTIRGTLGLLIEWDSFFCRRQPTRS
jgi:hypothetical protein